MSCYKCKYRGTVPGSAHSSCTVIRSTQEEKAEMLELLIAGGQLVLTDQDDNPIVKLDEYGIKSGWANWPLDFDPTWVDSCGFFKDKEEPVIETT